MNANASSGVRVKRGSESGEKREKYGRFFFSRHTHVELVRPMCCVQNYHAGVLCLAKPILRKKPTVLQSISYKNKRSLPTLLDIDQKKFINGP